MSAEIVAEKSIVCLSLGQASRMRLTSSIKLAPKASVLPEPVADPPIISFSASARGIVFSCISVGSVKPTASTVLRNASLKPSSLNVFIFIKRVLLSDIKPRQNLPFYSYRWRATSPSLSVSRFHIHTFSSFPARGRKLHAVQQPPEHKLQPAQLRPLLSSAR